MDQGMPRWPAKDYRASIHGDGGATPGRGQNSGATTNANGKQILSRGPSNGATFSTLGTKDIVLGPGGGMGQPRPQSTGSLASSGANGLGPAPAAGSLLSGNSPHIGRRSDKRDRERSVSQNKPNAPASAWRSNPSMSMSTPNLAALSPASRQQPWPQLNSATLGAFSKPPVAAAPIESQSRPTPPPPEPTQQQQRRQAAPRGFENAFPSLGNGANAGRPTGPAPVEAKGPTGKVWGKPDLVSSIVAAQPPQNNGNRPEMEADTAADDEEAAEIARLKALIPRLDKPKSYGKNSSSMRERSKSLSASKSLLPPAPSRSATFTKAAGANPRPSVLSSKAFTNQSGKATKPVMIANRPKLRSTLKASPRMPNGFDEGKTEVVIPDAKGDGNTENSPQSAASDANDLVETIDISCEDPESHSTDAEGSEGDSEASGSHPSTTNAVVTPSPTIEVHEDDENLFQLDGTDTLPAAVTEPVLRSSASSHSIASSIRSSTLDAVPPEDSGRDFTSSPMVFPSASVPKVETKDLLNLNEDDILGEILRDTTATLSPSGIIPSTSPISTSGARRPSPDPYKQAFQYSASLEREEAFLRSLGWNKAAYYDSDVDEKEFEITQEEKEEFFRGYHARLADSTSPGVGEQQLLPSLNGHQNNNQQQQQRAGGDSLYRMDDLFAGSSYHYPPSFTHSTTHPFTTAQHAHHHTHAAGIPNGIDTHGAYFPNGDATNSYPAPPASTSETFDFARQFQSAVGYHHHSHAPNGTPATTQHQRFTAF